MKRGRQKIRVFKYPLGFAGTLSSTTVAALESKLSMTPAYLALNPDQQRELVERLCDAIPNFQAAQQANRAYSGKVGNRPNRHIAVLLRDCRIALKKVSPESDWPFWERDDRSVESPAFQIGRACIEIATGRRYTASLRQQGRKATDWNCC